VIVTSKALPAVGVEVAGATEKNPGEVPLTGLDVVVVVPSGGVVRPSVVVVVEPGPVVLVVGVAVDVVAVPATVILAEVPDIPNELSVTSSTVVPGSKRTTFTVATPSAKVTLLPVVQSPWAG
jgi:hypothetical protein